MLMLFLDPGRPKPTYTNRTVIKHNKTMWEFAVSWQVSEQKSRKMLIF